MNIVDIIESRFKSMNSVPVRDIRITRAEWEELLALKFKSENGDSNERKNSISP